MESYANMVEAICDWPHGIDWLPLAVAYSAGTSGHTGPDGVYVVC